MGWAAKSLIRDRTPTSAVYYESGVRYHGSGHGLASITTVRSDQNLGKCKSCDNSRITGSVNKLIKKSVVAILCGRVDKAQNRYKVFYLRK